MQLYSCLILNTEISEMYSKTICNEEAVITILFWISEQECIVLSFNYTKMELY